MVFKEFHLTLYFGFTALCFSLSSFAFGTFVFPFAPQPAEEDIMTRPPRMPTKPLNGKLFMWRTTWISIVLMVMIIGNFQWSLNMGYNLARARTVAFNLLGTVVGHSMSIRHSLSPQLSITKILVVWHLSIFFFFSRTRQ